MKKTNHHKVLWITLIVLLLFTFYMAVVWGFFLPSWESRNGTYVKYQEMLLSENGTYIGIIDADSEKVRIIDRSGKEISYIETKGDLPDQIALGNTSYFLLYQKTDGKENDRIVQYDFQSKKIKECKASGTATIACRDGYLFLGEWKQEEEEISCYFQPYYNSFYAHSYVVEKKFGDSFQTLSLDQKVSSVVGGVRLYCHEEGYFSTEPVLEDYPGTSVGDFTAEDRDYDYQADTERETKNRELILNKIGEIQGVQDPICCVSEYQEQKMIYGICNIVENYIPSRPLKSDDVIKSYYYKINPEKDEITILGQTDETIAIIATDSILVYQRDEEIVQKNLVTSEEKVIYQIDNGRSKVVWVCVDGDFLLIREEERHMFADFFPEEKGTWAHVCWKD